MAYKGNLDGETFSDWEKMGFITGENDQTEGIVITPYGYMKTEKVRNYSQPGTVLHYAIVGINPEEVEDFLKNGCSPNIPFLDILGAQKLPLDVVDEHILRSDTGLNIYIEKAVETKEKL